MLGCGWYRGAYYPAEALIDRRSVDDLAEELVAAAHAACYAMAFSNGLAKNGTPPSRLDVAATVTFDKIEAGWRIVSSALTVRGDVPGIDASTFTELAEAAKEGCPISNALSDDIALSVEATLAQVTGSR